MPVDRTRYPDNWDDEIAPAIKERDGWKCVRCGGERGDERIGTKGKPYRIIITVQHLGMPFPDGTPGDKHNKMDCRPENLASMCQRCHLRDDVGEHLQTRRRKKREAQLAAGQLELFS